jgi:hypothetical protein
MRDGWAAVPGEAFRARGHAIRPAGHVDRQVKVRVHLHMCLKHPVFGRPRALAHNDPGVPLAVRLVAKDAIDVVVALQRLGEPAERRPRFGILRLAPHSLRAGPGTASCPSSYANGSRSAARIGLRPGNSATLEHLLPKPDPESTALRAIVLACRRCTEFAGTQPDNWGFFWRYCRRPTPSSWSELSAVDWVERACRRPSWRFWGTRGMGAYGASGPNCLDAEGGMRYSHPPDTKKCGMGVRWIAQTGQPPWPEAGPRAPVPKRACLTVKVPATRVSPAQRLAGSVAGFPGPRSPKTGCGGRWVPNAGWPATSSSKRPRNPSPGTSKGTGPCDRCWSGAESRSGIPFEWAVHNLLKV